MLLDDFRKEFLADLQASASVAANFTHNEFVGVCAELLSDAEELSDFEACYFRGTGSRNRALAMDGLAEDDVDGSIRRWLRTFRCRRDRDNNSANRQNLVQPLNRFL